MKSLPRSALRIERVETLVFRAPVATPVQTSFGIMRDRPAVFVRVTDHEGVQGLGEVWCNFPGCGAEHRANLVDTVMAPLLLGKSFDSPQAAFQMLSDKTAVLAIQSGEAGPMAQAIAGIDLALWDLSAKRAGEPLWRHLGGESDGVKVYASGLNPDRPWTEWQELASQCKAPLAAGENLLGEQAFDNAISHAPLAVVQPDIAKWGGISGCWPVIAAIQARGLRYCPHYLGGGIGLLASAHLLAAVGGDGILEIDANPNPLRSLLAGPLGQIREGKAALGQAAGLGMTLDSLEGFSGRVR